MSKYVLAAGIAAAALIPSFAFAQTSCEQQRNTRVAGTVAGAGIGALAGGAIAGHDDRAKGAVIGAIAGGLIGNQVAKPKADCAHAYGYYDSNGAWHANAIEQSAAAGYFDRNGVWVDGQPNGYYDAQNRWVATNAGSNAAGYRDRDGHWVPASASGYYATDGRWVAGSAPGHYDERGRWVAGATAGRYDQNGRWVTSQPAGHRDANGVWVPDPQPGYYENGRWVAQPAMGYYDAQGRFVRTGPSQARYTTGAYDQSNNNHWNGAPDGFIQRTTWLENRVRRAMSQGTISGRDGQRSLRALTAVRQEERGLRHRGGRLGQNDEARMQAKLDAIATDIRWSRDDEQRRDSERGYNDQRGYDNQRRN